VILYVVSQWYQVSRRMLNNSSLTNYRCEPTKTAGVSVACICWVKSAQNELWNQLTEWTVWNGKFRWFIGLFSVNEECEWRMWMGIEGAWLPLPMTNKFVNFAQSLCTTCMPIIVHPDSPPNCPKCNPPDFQYRENHRCLSPSRWEMSQ